MSINSESVQIRKKTKKTTMKITHYSDGVYRLRTLLLAGALTALSFVACGGVFVETTPQGTIHWETLFARSVDLPVEWPTRATSAVLSVKDLAGSSSLTTVAAGATSVTWTPLAPNEIPAEDRLYTLVLSFLDKNHSCVGAETARVAVVRSVFTGACDVKKQIMGKPVKMANVAIFAYDATWIGGAANEIAYLSATAPDLAWSEIRCNSSGWSGNKFTPAWIGTQPTVSCAFSESKRLEAQIRFAAGMILVFR